MPVASYQSSNDYNLVKDIHPFELPYQSMMQEIATKNQYWKVGADRVKSIYDQAANLDPQYIQNKDYLKSFMSEANQSLQKLSKSDLAVMDNSQQAANVFKPLFDTNNPVNTSLLMDSQLNQFYKKQEQLSNTYRTKDGGKEWNQNNDFYFRSAQQKYLEDAKKGDFSTIEKNYQNRKSYIPYYDYKKEITDIQEACKGASIESQDVSSKNSMYLEHNTYKGCDPQRLALAFQTGLSDRAKQQIHIDGFVNYQGNEDVLLKDYENYMLGNTQAQINQLSTQLAGLKAGKIGAKEQEKINDLMAALSILKPKYEEAKSEYDQITKGNPIEYIKNNYDKLSGSLYFNKLSNSLGEAYRTDDIKKLVLPNAVAMLEYKTNSEIASQMRQFAHDDQNDILNSNLRKSEIELKSQKDKELSVLKGEITAGGATSPSPVFPNIKDNVDIPTVSENQFKETELIPAQEKASSDYEVLKSYIQQKYATNKDIDVTEKGLAEFMNQHNSKNIVDQDPKLIEYYNKFEESNNRLKSKINTIKAVDVQIKKDRPDLFDDSKLDKTKFSNYKLQLSFDLNSPVITPPPISEQDMSKIIKGENVNGFTMEWKDKSVAGPNGWKGNLNSEGKANILYYNGKIISPSITTNQDIYYLLWKTQQKKSEVNTEIDKLKTEKYTSQYYNNGSYTVNNLTVKDKSLVDQRLKSSLGIIGGLNEKNGYTILYRDKTGEGVYVLPLDAEGVPIKPSGATDNILANIKGDNSDNDIVNTPKGKAYYIKGIAPRYEDLPDDNTLNKFQSQIDDVRNLKSIISSDSRMQSGSLVDSKSFGDGTGVILMKTSRGYPATISILKEGNGANTQIKYIANISLKNGEVIEKEANTPEQIIAIVKQAY